MYIFSVIYLCIYLAYIYSAQHIFLYGDAIIFHLELLPFKIRQEQYNYFQYVYYIYVNNELHVWL